MGRSARSDAGHGAVAFQYADGQPVPYRKENQMPLFMDVHKLPGPLTAAEVADAHAADLKVQAEYGVHYLRYWVDEQQGTIFCLVDAPDTEAAHAVHREAHGLVADEIHPVIEGA
jgi:hypothetical protein